MPPEAAERLVPDDKSGEALRRQLESVRQLGYAVSHDELQLGVAGLAAPVLDAGGSPVGSIAILVPSGRAGTLGAYTDAVIEAGRRASAALAATDVRPAVAAGQQSVG
jgi:DNA-binding IclR family transcriptional regulator